MQKLKSTINQVLFFQAILFFLQSNYFNAQYKLFISPEFNTKTSFAFVDPDDLYNNEHNFLENQFIYKPYSIAYSSRLVKHQTPVIGLFMVCMFKQDTRFIRLTYTKDVATFRAYSYFRSYYGESHSGFEINNYGIGFHRFHIEYGLRLSSQSKPQIIHTWLTIGAGVNVNRNRWTSIFPFQWDLNLNPNGDKLICTYLRPFEENRINGCLKIGLENDLFLKNKYIFSFNLNYLQGLGIITRVEYVHEYFLNGTNVYNGTGLMSRGSGLYVGINRRFQIYHRKQKKV